MFSFCENLSGIAPSFPLIKRAALALKNLLEKAFVTIAFVYIVIILQNNTLIYIKLVGIM